MPETDQPPTEDPRPGGLRPGSGVPFERGEGSMAKLAASEVAVKTTERAIQTMGGWGYIKESHN